MSPRVDLVLPTAAVLAVGSAALAAISFRPPEQPAILATREAARAAAQLAAERPRNDPQPRIVVEKQIIRLSPDEILRGKGCRVAILNDGDAPLRLKCGHPSNRITDFDAPGGIQPGMWDYLTIRWTTPRDRPTATWSAWGELYTNDRERRLLRFVLLADENAPANE